MIAPLTCAVHMRAAPMPSIADIVYSKYTFSINNCAINPADIDHKLTFSLIEYFNHHNYLQLHKGAHLCIRLKLSAKKYSQ